MQQIPYLVYEVDTGRVMTAWNMQMPPVQYVPEGCAVAEVDLAAIGTAMQCGEYQAAYYDPESGSVSLVDEKPLDIAKDDKVKELESATKQFIEYASADKRYTQEKQCSFNSIMQICQLKLSDPSTSQEERDACQVRVGKLMQVFSWISSVLDYHYQVNDSIRAAADKTELKSISWDFSAFDATDPDIRLQEVKF